MAYTDAPAHNTDVVIEGLKAKLDAAMAQRMREMAAQQVVWGGVPSDVPRRADVAGTSPMSINLSAAVDNCLELSQKLVSILGLNVSDVLAIDHDHPRGQTPTNPDTLHIRIESECERLDTCQLLLMAAIDEAAHSEHMLRRPE